MRQKVWHRLSRVFVVFAVLVAAYSIPAVASATCVSNQQSCSTTYGVGETHFGSGGQVCIPGTNGSANYCADMSAGDLNVGSASSTNYQTHAGSGLSTHREPYLEFSAGGVSTDLGTLDVSKTATVNANFTIKTYLADGYTIQVASQPPIDNAPGHHVFNVPSTPSVPSPGTEMFGMNLIANSTNPSGGSTPYGANPSCAPDSSFCPSGAMSSSITSNYNQDGKYYYPSGPNYTDTVVNSNTSTGAVSYTLSFVYDISSVTPDGLYTYNGVFVATSTY